MFGSYRTLEQKRAADRKNQAAVRRRKREARIAAGWKPTPCSMCLSVEHVYFNCPLNVRATAPVGGFCEEV